MPFNFEITDDNSVLIFAEDSSTPCLVQDTNPAGKPWGSTEEANLWAVAYVDGLDEKIKSDIETFESEKLAADEAAASLEKPESELAEEPAPTEG